MVLAGCLVFAAGSATAETPAVQPEWPSLVVMLIRDPAVQAELSLSPEQVTKVGAAVQAVDRDLWVLRDLQPAEGVPKQDKLVAQVSAALKTTLDPQQRRRFDQLLIQARGVEGLTRPSVAKRLGLEASQQEQLQAIQAQTARAAAELKQRARSGTSPALQAEFATLQAEGRRRLTAVLTDEQRQRLTGLTGKPFEFAKIKRIAATAPEVAGVDEWLGGPPQSLAELRGKVVVLHFFAFGCINCIHNYPWYKQWQRDFANRDVVILGIHTPETEQERNVDQLRDKLREEGLEFPVAVDAKNEVWNAWGNHIWPAVYLIDKQGQVRHWWYGELEWNGAGGEKQLRGKIESLLAEETEARRD
jgi:peroxiredoxin